MGKYINEINGTSLGTTFENKVAVLLAKGAIAISTPKEWVEDLVVVIDNGPFAAAAYAYDEREMNAFIQGRNSRPWAWLNFKNANKYAS